MRQIYPSILRLLGIKWLYSKMFIERQESVRRRNRPDPKAMFSCEGCLEDFKWGQLKIGEDGKLRCGGCRLPWMKHRRPKMMLEKAPTAGKTTVKGLYCWTEEEYGAAAKVILIPTLKLDQESLGKRSIEREQRGRLLGIRYG